MMICQLIMAMYVRTSQNVNTIQVITNEHYVLSDNFNQSQIMNSFDSYTNSIFIGISILDVIWRRFVKSHPPFLLIYFVHLHLKHYFQLQIQWLEMQPLDLLSL